MLSEIEIIDATIGDAVSIVDLYRSVAAVEGGLARSANEITSDYVESFVAGSIKTGIILIARQKDSPETLAGEIHGYAIGPRVFAHVIGELTIAVHPDAQGHGVGRKLFTAFMLRIAADHPQILRVELIARESNAKAIRFYESLGFVVEGKMKGRIHSVGGGYEADIPMAWHRDTDNV